MATLLKSLSSQAGAVFKFFVSTKANKEKEKQRVVDAPDDKGKNHVAEAAILNHQESFEHTPRTAPLETLSRSSTSVSPPSRKRKRQMKKVTPTPRRKKTRWTEVEVAKLEEGMKIYENTKTRWKNSLKFGETIFKEKGRRAGDLKDKWRNMKKQKEKLNLQGLETLGVQEDRS